MTKVKVNGEEIEVPTQVLVEAACDYQLTQRLGRIIERLAHTYMPALKDLKECDKCQ